MKRLGLSVTLAVVVLLSIVAPVLAAYYVDIDVTESNGITYTNQPILAEVSVGDMADNHFCLAGATDLRVLDSNENELSFMPSDDYVTFIGNLTASTTTDFQLTTGNTPLSTFPVICGEGGYVLTFDNADLELGTNFSMELDGYFDTSTDIQTPSYPDVSGVMAKTTSTVTANTTSHNVTLPGLFWTVVGDLALIVFQTYSPTNVHNITPLSGWVTLVNTTNTTRNLYVAYKESDGTEGGSAIITTTDDCFSACQGFRFNDGDGLDYYGAPEIAYTSESSTSTPNPPSLSPSWGEAPVFCIAGFGGGTNTSQSVNAYPTDYGNTNYVESGNATQTAYTHIGTAYRVLPMTSEDPGAYTLSFGSNARGFTIALRGVEPSTYFIGKDNAFYVYPDDGTINACYFAGLIRTVSANMTTGEHTVTAWADGTNLGIDVDGATEDTALQYTTGVPDATSWWTIKNMPYFNYYQHGIGIGDTARYEYYNTGATSGWSFYGSTWAAQTFTPSTTHTITSANLSLYRVGSPGTLNVSVWETDGSGHPTGSVLCSGTTDGDSLNVYASWRSVSLGSGATVSASTKYAISLSAPSGSAGNIAVWGYDGTAPPYSGGNGETSSDSGASWSDQSVDFLFEEYGTSPNIVLTYQPDSLIEGSVLPNEEDPGTYDGLIMFGTNPAGVSVDVDTLQSDQTYYYYTETDATTPDVIDIEPAAMTGDVDLDKLENNPLNPMIESLADSSNGQLNARLIWLGLGWFVFIGAMIFVFLKTKQNIVFTTATGLGLSVILYSMGIFNYAVIILLGIGFIAAIVHERMPTW